MNGGARYRVGTASPATNAVVLRRGGAIGLVALLALFGCGWLAPTYRAEGADRGAGVAVEVRFAGNQGLGTYQLQRQIEDYLLELSRDPGRETVAFDAAADLLEFYRSSGYPDATVDYALARGGTGAADPLLVTFAIREGPLVTVRELQIIGNQACTGAELLALWEREHTGLLGLGDAILAEPALADLVVDIANLYRSRGYLDVEVAAPEITRAAGAAVASVRITVREGPCYDFGAFAVDEALRVAAGDALPPPPTGAFSRRATQDYALVLRSQLRRRGHPEPIVRVASAVNRATRRVDVVVSGEPGLRAVNAGLEVRGNQRIRTALIAGMLDLREGEPWDGDVEEQGLRRLYLTNLFTAVRVEHEWIDAERMRTIVAVEEADTRSAEVSVGYGSYEQARGGVRLEERSLFGTSVQGSVLGRLSQKGYRTGAALTEPDLFRSETDLTIGTEFFRRKEPSFTDEALGVSASLSRRLTTGVTARTGYGFRDHADAFAEVVDPRSSLVDYREGRIFVDVQHDRRDNVLVPKSGHQQSLSFEILDEGLGGDVSLLRLQAGATAHLPLTSRLRLVLRAEAGWLWPGDGSANVPLQERFFNGGESTVRSFRESQLGPRDITGEPTGGEYRNVFSAELRLSLWKTLEAALFGDAGNVGRNVGDYGLSDLRYGLGAGLRLVLPIGPVRVDAAWNPDREVGEEEWVLHFTVGYPF